MEYLLPFNLLIIVDMVFFIISGFLLCRVSVKQLKRYIILKI